jgi:hypothetical protein
MPPVTQVLNQPAGPKADGEHLRRAQAQTLAAPRFRYGIAVRLLVRCMDAVYGQAGSFPKYQVLELVARVPYQTWERVAYRAINRLYRQTGLARRVHERIVEAREQQDNEDRCHRRARTRGCGGSSRTAPGSPRSPTAARSRTRTSSADPAPASRPANAATGARTA